MPTVPRPLLWVRLVESCRESWVVSRDSGEGQKLPGGEGETKNFEIGGIATTCATFGV